MDRNVIFGMGAAAVVAGYVGYKFFSGLESGNSSEAPKALPVVRPQVVAAVVETCVSTVEVTVEEDLSVQQVVETTPVVTPQAEPEPEIGMASVEIAPTMENHDPVYNEVKHAAYRRLDESNQEAVRTGDQNAMFKGTFDTYVAGMFDPQTLNQLGDAFKLQVSRSHTMLTFPSPYPDSPIVTYRIESDLTSIRGVELRMRDGSRRYDRHVDGIVDALFALSTAFRERAGDVVPAIEVVTPQPTES